jgi:hypothetical protein
MGVLTLPDSESLDVSDATFVRPDRIVPVGGQRPATAGRPTEWGEIVVGKS